MGPLSEEALLSLFTQCKQGDDIPGSGKGKESAPTQSVIQGNRTGRTEHDLLSVMPRAESQTESEVT